MERLTQILFVLSRSQDRTATTERLLAHVSYGSERPEDRRRQLTRDIGHLNELGWNIASVSAEGEAGRYHLVAGDLRLRVQLSPAEQAELQRAARLAGAGGTAGTDGGPTADEGDRMGASHLEAVHRAVTAHCLLEVDYRGSRRRLQPHSLHLRTGGWYLRAQEDGGAEVKTFRLDRMSAVMLGQPGTAAVPPAQQHLLIDPIGWQVDPPVVAVLATTVEHEPQVRAMLATGSDEDESGDSGSTDAAASEVRLRLLVTNRAAFRSRLYELGSRVRLLGPTELRDEVRDHLLAVVAGRA